MAPADPLVRPSHYQCLDGLRGVAVLLVIVFHFGAIAAPETLVGRLFSRGWMGVDLFFVLSGFLISGILLDTRRSVNYFRAFYVRRFLRIFPLYYGTLIVWFLIVPRLLPVSAQTVRPDLAPWYWLYLSNFLVDDRVWILDHFWSLAIEEQFYLVWPAVVAFGGPRRLAWVAVSVIGFALCFRAYLLWDSQPFYAIHGGTFARADALCVGALCALVVRAPRIAQLVDITWARLALVALASWMAVALLSRGYALETAAVQLVGYSVTAVLTGVTMLGLVLPTTPETSSGAFPRRTLERILSLRSLRHVGKYSYGMYVVHWPLKCLMYDAVIADLSWRSFTSTTGGALLFVSAGLIASYAVAVGVWHGFEKHFLKLKEHFKPRLPAPQAVS